MINDCQITTYEIRRRSAEGQTKARRTCLARTLARLIVDLTDMVHKIPGSDYWTYFAKMAETIGKKTTTQYRWRVFIEVWQDADNDGEILGDEANDPFWIEVCGLRMAWGPDTAWLPDFGYESWECAADAGGTAVHWARQNGGFVPTHGSVWGHALAPGWSGSPYLTHKHYRPAFSVVNAIKTARQWINYWKRVYGAVKPRAARRQDERWSGSDFVRLRYLASYYYVTRWDIEESV